MYLHSRQGDEINSYFKIQNNVKLGFQLASGSEDPFSTNQTLTEGFSSKQINIDPAFFEWRPDAVNGLTVAEGKVKKLFQAQSKFLFKIFINPGNLLIEIFIHFVLNNVLFVIRADNFYF